MIIEPGIAHAAADDELVSLVSLNGTLPSDNLTARARGSGDSLAAAFSSDLKYQSFFQSFCRALYRRTPQHSLLIRERGVGDQIVLLELSRRALAGQPPFLRDKTILGLDCRSVSSHEIKSLFENALAKVIAREDIILCIDGFANLLRHSDSRENEMAMQAILARSRGRIVGILAPREFEDYLSPHPELRDSFSVVLLHEPSHSVALDLTRHFAVGLQVEYGVRADEEAIRQAVTLSDSYILHDRLPSKAMKTLRAIAEDIDYERSQNGITRESISGDDVVAKIAETTGIPATTISGVGETIDYCQSLRELIVGQDHAVCEVGMELGLIKAGLVDRNKPASVMMFIGQTGTGKTALAKALATFYSSSKRLKTFTLGNFSEPHSVSGLIGVPAGYVGHDQGGRLINELNADPYGVFLLDEADKAHPDVLQPFLNLFDEGWICDQRGAKAHADRAIFILTTNVGQRQIADLFKNGKTIEEVTSVMKESLSRIRHTKSNRPVFAPEFLARIKKFIVFRPLDRPAMLGICTRLIGQLQNEWNLKRQKTLEVSSELINEIARRGSAIEEKSAGREGGRIIRKLISDLIESNIQSAIAKAPHEYIKCSAVLVGPQVVGMSDPTAASDELSAGLREIQVSFRLKLTNTFSGRECEGE